VNTLANVLGAQPRGTVRRVGCSALLGTRLNTIQEASEPKSRTAATAVLTTVVSTVLSIEISPARTTSQTHKTIVAARLAAHCEKRDKRTAL